MEMGQLLTTDSLQLSNGAAPVTGFDGLSFLDQQLIEPPFRTFKCECEAIFQLTKKPLRPHVLVFCLGQKQL